MSYTHDIKDLFKPRCSHELTLRIVADGVEFTHPDTDNKMHLTHHQLVQQDEYLVPLITQWLEVCHEPGR